MHGLTDSGSSSHTQLAARAAMVKLLWPVPHCSRSKTCTACHTAGGDRFYCDRCEAQYCGYCCHSKHHKCRGKNDQRPATTSKAPAQAHCAQPRRGAVTAAAHPMPPPQRQHSTKPQVPAASNAPQRHSSSSSNKQGEQAKKSDRQHVTDVHTTQGSAPIKRVQHQSPPRPASRELSPYLPKGPAQQGKDPERSWQTKHGDRDRKRRRRTSYYHSPRPAKQAPLSPSPSSTSSPREITKEHPSPARPETPEPGIDEGQAWVTSAEDGREVEITHTYRIKESVYDAVAQAIRAGYKLDRNRTTWGLSQLHPEAAFRIMSNLAHPMYTIPQQYIDHCIGDEWHKNSTQQQVHQPHRHALATSAKDSAGRLHNTKPKTW